VKVLNKPAGATHNSANDVVEGAPEVDEYLREGSVDLVINIPEGNASTLLLFVHYFVMLGMRVVLNQQYFM
jgi:hypothetical protein